MTQARIEGNTAPHRLPNVVIEPRGGTSEWLELWHYRDLFRILAERDVRLRYRQTALGIVWVILQPLAASLIFASIFGVFAKLPSQGEPYLVFVFAAMLPWSLFSSGLQRGANSLIGNSGLITKVYFPRPIIPIASISAVLLDFLVGSAVMVVLMLAYGLPFSVTILAIPLFVAMTLITTIGMSLLLSALGVYYRDFSAVIPFLIQIWMYATPVVYASSLVPERWQLLYGLNPMVGVVDGFRWALLGVPMPAATLLESVVVGCLILLAGATTFRRVERTFADVI